MNDLKTCDELYNYMSNISYGYIGCDGTRNKEDFSNFSNDYKLQSPKELIDSKIGVCWDQVELERYFFENNKYIFNTYFIVYYDDDKCPTHTFLIYKENDKYYWFESAWELCRGIHEYNSEIDALKDIRSKYIDSELNNECDLSNLFIYKYDRPNYGINCAEFYKHCEQGEKIDF